MKREYVKPSVRDYHHADVMPGTDCLRCGQRKPLIDTEMFNSSTCTLKAIAPELPVN